MHATRRSARHLRAWRRKRGEESAPKNAPSEVLPRCWGLRASSANFRRGRWPASSPERRLRVHHQPRTFRIHSIFQYSGWL